MFLGGKGSPIWGFPYNPLLVDPCTVVQEPSLDCLSPGSAAFTKQEEVSLSARAGSLMLPVAKTRIVAGELTVTLALCRTIALHGPSCRSGCITYLMLQFFVGMSMER